VPMYGNDDDLFPEELVQCSMGLPIMDIERGT
jgi:hypothetical protein